MAGNLWRFKQRLIRLSRIAALAVVCTVAGCAAGDADADTEAGGGYEERLTATAKEFDYYQLLNENLAEPVWKAKGIRLRVPWPFQLLDASNREALSGELLGTPLPGVLGIWQAVLPGNDGADPQTAYLFVMSNHHPQSKIQGEAFHQTLVESVLAKLPGLVQLPIESDWKIANLSGHGSPFTFASFEATLAKTKMPADFTLFLMQHGKNDRRDEIKVAMLFIVPRSAEFSGSRADIDPMQLSAKTLQITP